MDKQFGFCRKIVVDNIIQEWDINTTGRNVCSDHNMCLFSLKFGCMNFTGCLIQTGVNVSIGDPGFVKQLGNKYFVNIYQSF